MGSLFRFLFNTAVVLGVLVGAARLVAIRWWRIPDNDPVLEASITPTLRGGDWVLLWRATPPGFGTLVACPDPEDPNSTVIGRIAAEARDILKIEGDRLYLNGHPVHDETTCAEAIFEVADPSSGSSIRQHCDMEALGGNTHMRGTLQGISVRGDPTTREVGERHVFLVSDNRAFPYDSRNYGSLERSTCTETVLFRLVGAGGFFDVDSRLTYIR